MPGEGLLAHFKNALAIPLRVGAGLPADSL
jgi:hypothetical protein